MDQYNLSTIPVIDGDKCVGSLRESKLINKVINDRTISGSNIKQVMEKKLSMIDYYTPFPKALDMLHEENAILVTQHGIIKGILTRYDVLDFV